MASLSQVGSNKLVLGVGSLCFSFHDSLHQPFDLSVDYKPRSDKKFCSLNDAASEHFVSLRGAYPLRPHGTCNGTVPKAEKDVGSGKL